MTDFVGWTPDGELQVLVTLSAKVGLNEAFKDLGLDIPNIQNCPVDALKQERIPPLTIE